MTFAFKVLSLASALFFLFSCGAPALEDLLNKGVNCQAEITLPEDAYSRLGEKMEVSVKIYSCVKAAEK